MPLRSKASNAIQGDSCPSPGAETMRLGDSIRNQIHGKTSISEINVLHYNMEDFAAICHEILKLFGLLKSHVQFPSCPS